MAVALERLNTIRAPQVQCLGHSRVPPNRLKVLARQAAKSKAQSIARMDRARRRATLLAFASEGEAIATDDALDIFDAFMKDVSSRAKTEGRRPGLNLCRLKFNVNQERQRLWLATSHEINSDKTDEYGEHAY